MKKRAGNVIYSTRFFLTAMDLLLRVITSQGVGVDMDRQTLFVDDFRPFGANSSFEFARLFEVA
jgi:hypothetical protein